MWVGGNIYAIGEVVEGRKHDLITQSSNLKHDHDYDNVCEYEREH